MASPKNNNYKSKYERTVAAALAKAKVSFRYESDTFDYPHTNRRGACRDCGSKNVAVMRTYTPDFRIRPNGGLNPRGEFYLETKGKFTSEDRTKMLEVIAHHPKVKFRMLFMRDNKLNRKSNTRYSDWCRKHGIEFAVGVEVPNTWLL